MGFDRLKYYADLQNPNSRLNKLNRQWNGYSLTEFLRAVGKQEDDDGQDR